MERVTKQAILRRFSQCADLQCRRLSVGGSSESAWLLYIEGLVSTEAVAQQVIRPLTDKLRFEGRADVLRMDMGLVYPGAGKKRDDPDDVAQDLLDGWCALLPPGGDCALTFEVRSQDHRSIDSPKEEKVVKGAKDAFIEQLRMNTALVRRKLHTTQLKSRELTVGRISQTRVSIMWLAGTADPQLPGLMESRLSRIDSDGVLCPANIEEFLVDSPSSPFPQLITTERPDRFCMNLLEGRVGVLVDGLPLGFLAPGTFTQYFKMPEDVAEHFTVASVITLLRYFALLLALFLPAVYVALAMYHQEMLPTKLVQSMVQAKQSVPFPTAVEVLAMLVAFELLQEAGLRLPNSVGETVGIVGALIVGQSAVEAKMLSPVVVVIVALAGICGYVMPDQRMGAALRAARLVLVLAAIVWGLYGVCGGAVLILYHLCRLESFGKPYLTPFAGRYAGDIAAAMLRRPLNRKGGPEKGEDAP